MLKNIFKSQTKYESIVAYVFIFLPLTSKNLKLAIEGIKTITQDSLVITKLIRDIKSFCISNV